MAVQSVERAIDILMLFGPDKPRLGVTEIAHALDLRKATAHGLIHTLEQRGFLKKDPQTRKYGLGLAIFELGYFLSGSLEINQKAGGTANLLAGESNLICRVGLWSRMAVLVVINSLPQHLSPFVHQYGPRVPAYCTAIGKAILAFLEPDQLDEYLAHATLRRLTPQTITDPGALKGELEEVRRRGYAVGNREFSPTSTGIAAPLFQEGGKVMGAMSLSGSHEVVLGPEREKLVSRLMLASQSVSRAMGFIPGFQSPEAI